MSVFPRLIPIPYPCADSEYEAIMSTFVNEAKRQGVECIAFGDLFLEDVRRYREAKLAETGITPLFPLWGLPTRELSREMVNQGLRARITCIDPKKLTPDFAGRNITGPFWTGFRPMWIRAVKRRVSHVCL